MLRFFGTARIEKFNARYAIIILAAVIGVLATSILGEPAEKVSRPGHYQGYSFPKYEGIESSSFYLPMRDGVKIAVDLHLPKGLDEGEKVPTILFQTRYVRSMDLRWPFSLFKESSPEVGTTIKLFVPRGYAWVSADVRGSGASFGTRPYPWSPDEVKDGAEIVDWIISQPWSDGTVGSLGWSYTGSASEFLLLNNHPAVKAVAPRFSLFDVYTDIAFPGGVQLRWFTKTWARVNSILDRNAMSEFGLLAGLSVRGTKPVDADKDRSMLAAAISEHQGNYNVHEQVLGITYRDDVAPSGLGTIDNFSPSAFVDKLNSSGAAIYSYSGWFDGAYPHAAIKRFLTLTNPQKLIIGPWPHSVKIRQWWPNAQEVEYDHDAEMLRFFDYYLKGIDNGIMDEKPVCYYTMVEEAWKWADTWPPPSETRRYFFSDGNRLGTDEPVASEGSDMYRVDYTTGTGLTSRWVSLVNVEEVPIEYKGRKKEDEKLLCYTSPPLEQDTEVTGHPIVRLYVSSTADDGNFFAYLEDVDPTGDVTYVTEGELRALHRKLSDEKPPYVDVVPYRTFNRRDAMPLVPGEVAELVFDLLPTSYLYKKGHSIRVAIAGADKDHFALMKTDPPPTLTVFRNKHHASAIDLPVVR